jgi:3-oxoacyl-[acyl-carrier-protein] synthase III
LERQARQYLHGAGTETRYCLADYERPLDLAVDAAEAAMLSAGTQKQDIDFLIYAGVARGWIEPSTAPAVQQALGIPRATAFDVVDACAAWLRALQIAQEFVSVGAYRTGLIINAESGLYRNYLKVSVATPTELEARLASYTLGEAATATIVTGHNPDSRAYIAFRTLPEYLPLCLIPLPNMLDFIPTPPEELLEPHRFWTASGDLLRAAARAIVQMYRADPRLHDTAHDISFGHSASAKAERLIADQLGIADRYYPIHARYGNTGAASLPLGMSLAIDDGRLRRGDRVLLVLGSAGLTVGFGSLTF